MMRIQKIEFWLFSVPALLVAFGGIAPVARRRGYVREERAGRLIGRLGRKKRTQGNGEGFWRTGGMQQAYNSKGNEKRVGRVASRVFCYYDFSHRRRMKHTAQTMMRHRP